MLMSPVLQAIQAGWDERSKDERYPIIIYLSYLILA